MAREMAGDGRRWQEMAGDGSEEEGALEWSANRARRVVGLTGSGLGAVLTARSARALSDIVRSKYL
jgi:hypothetical protein